MPLRHGAKLNSSTAAVLYKNYQYCLIPPRPNHFYILWPPPQTSIILVGFYLIDQHKVVNIVRWEENFTFYIHFFPYMFLWAKTNQIECRTSMNTDFQVLPHILVWNEVCTLTVSVYNMNTLMLHLCLRVYGWTFRLICTSLSQNRALFSSIHRLFNCGKMISFLASKSFCVVVVFWTVLFFCQATLQV